LRSHVQIRRFLADDESGATAIEYGIICGMIAVVVLGIAATGGAVDLLYQKMAALATAILGSGSGGG
jgi:Flp pilus assembly pilin Flp